MVSILLWKGLFGSNADGMAQSREGMGSSVLERELEEVLGGDGCPVVKTFFLLIEDSSVYCSELTMINSLVSLSWLCLPTSSSSLACLFLPAPKARASKMLNLVNYRLKVTLCVQNRWSQTRASADVRHSRRNDGRAMIGQMLAYDKHMNLVLAECEEFRRVKVSSFALTAIPKP
jgi:hypothetical protein